MGRGVYRVLVGKPEGKRPLGRPRSGWEDNIKMEAGCWGMDWIDLAPWTGMIWLRIGAGVGHLYMR
jgi:hypothetical protein